MFSRALLRVTRARWGLRCLDMSRGSAPIVCLIAWDAQRLPQGLALHNPRVLAPPQHGGPDRATTVIARLPQPSGGFFPRPACPHVVAFRFRSDAHDHRYRIWIQQGESTRVDMAPRRRFFSTPANCAKV